MGTKCLISLGNYENWMGFVTDSGTRLALNLRFIIDP